MNTSPKISHDKAYEQDVRTMSYEELMETIRFLDNEREEIRKSVEQQSENVLHQAELKKRAA
jgi:hypothetical protein